MACLKVQGLNYIRLIAEEADGNVRGMRPGEVVIGSDLRCGASSLDYDFDSWVTSEGIMVGNIIKKVTSTLGIKQCLACKGRQQRYNKRGIELQRKLKELF